jgi:metal-responsive CopG/Arc/MetJ family transcriptional regulator
MDYRIPPGRIHRVSELIQSPGTKAKVSVTLARGLLVAADQVAGETGRSQLIEHAVRHYLRMLVRRTRHQRELALLDAHAVRLNAAAEQALADQAELDVE